MTEKQKNAINMAINTLNQITVSGQGNLSRMLGVIQLLGEMMNEERESEGNGNGIGD